MNSLVNHPNQFNVFCNCQKSSLKPVLFSISEPTLVPILWEDVCCGDEPEDLSHLNHLSQGPSNEQCIKEGQHGWRDCQLDVHWCAEVHGSHSLSQHALVRLCLEIKKWTSEQPHGNIMPYQLLHSTLINRKVKS